MDVTVFDELNPVCPRCLHGAQMAAPLTIADRIETRDGKLWHGMLHCSHSACWMEYPVIDGVPVIVPDPSAFVAGARHHILTREDLPAALHSVIGDACGPGSEFDTTRHHLSLYAGSHFADWMGMAGQAPFADVAQTALVLLGALPDAPAIDLGGGVGRGTYELARCTGGAVVCADLNFSMLRLAQHLFRTGQAEVPIRRVGIVYDLCAVTAPADAGALRCDFWAMDAMALPFEAETFATASAINVVDCIPGPTELIAETARILRVGGGAVFTTPYDWSATVAEPAGWMGGHSQRGPWRGASEPVLRATLQQYGLSPNAERSDVPWRLALHERSVMEYLLDVVACRRVSDDAASDRNSD